MSDDLHGMIDIETLGTSPGCVVLSVGAVLFNPHDDLLPLEGDEETFYVNIDKVKSLNMGFTQDQETVLWWDRQSAEAKRKLVNPDPMGVHEAMDQLSDWLLGFSPEKVWAHGKDFDLPILEEVMKRTRTIIPWKFWQTMDTRTLFSIAYPEGSSLKNITGNKNSHGALDDALNQAEAVQMSYAKLRGWSSAEESER